ncbi:hypothetical protein ACHAXN_006483 [Cyclotella atomus]
MMKSHAKTVLCGVLFSLLIFQSGAFAPTKLTIKHQPLKRSTHLSETSSEDYLRELWQVETIVERDIVVQDTIQGKEKDVTKHIVTEMLETALEHVHVLEKEKEKIAKEANARFERAAQDERVLSEFVEDYNLGEDVPIVDNYVSSRLHEAEHEELEAMKEEDEAVREYKDLRDKEETIKDLLRQMKKLGP